MSKNVVSTKNYFTNLTPGKLTGLKGVTDKSGRFKVLALDQSNSFRKFLKKQFERTGRSEAPTFEDIRDAKMEITRELAGAGEATAVLLDVNYGARQALNSGALPKGVGLIVRSEASRDAGLPGEYEPGWNIDKLKKMGGTAVKLLVYLDMEDKPATDHQIKFLEELASACRKNDMLLMIEELSYPRKGETKIDASYKKRLPTNIFKSTELLNHYADVLKLEFPGDIETDSTKQIQENLAHLTELTQRPWVLLSAGVKFDLFEKQVELAMKAGCSGTMAGRAIFQEYFDVDTTKDKLNFLRKEGISRMKKLNALVDSYAVPWQKRTGVSNQDLANAVNPDWYLAGEKVLAGAGATTGDY